MSIEPVNGGQRSREVVEERRARAYSLYLRGFSERQIAETLHINQSTVSRALKAKRVENAKRFEADGAAYLRSFLQEERDRYSDLLQEAWTHYHGIAETNVKARSQALGVIKGTLAAMGQLASRLVAELHTLRFDERMEELEEYVKGDESETDI